MKHMIKNLDIKGIEFFLIKIQKVTDLNYFLRRVTSRLPQAGFEPATFPFLNFNCF